MNHNHQDKTAVDRSRSVATNFHSDKVKVLPPVPVIKNNTAQKKDTGEDNLTIQGRSVIQQKEPDEEKLPVQYIVHSSNADQQAAVPPPPISKSYLLKNPVVRKKANATGLPDHLKTGIESLSGLSMNDVKVHYNSDKPAQMQALAFAQGPDIHMAPGEERHLPHEAWHVVQQKQGRVKPTLQMKDGVHINDDSGLEQEATVMGEKALQGVIQKSDDVNPDVKPTTTIIQRKVIVRLRTKKIHPELPRIINEIRIEGRAPTDAPGSGQGDHTVAETLINESTIREVLTFPTKIALNNLLFLADLTLSDENVQQLQHKYGPYWTTWDSMEGEDQNTIIENLMQEYIELANKRPGTAYAKKQDLTAGGGDEKKGIGFIRKFADKVTGGGVISNEDISDAAQHLSFLIDMKYKKGSEDRYINVLVRALQHSGLSVFPLLAKPLVDKLITDLIFLLQKRDNIPEDALYDIYKIITHELGL